MKSELETTSRMVPAIKAQRYGRINLNMLRALLKSFLVDDIDRKVRYEGNGVGGKMFFLFGVLTIQVPGWSIYGLAYVLREFFTIKNSK